MACESDPIRREYTDIAHWNRLTQDPLFQIIASLRLHNDAWEDFNVPERRHFLEAEAKGKLHRARAADLEDRTHLARDVARAESVSKRFVGGAKAQTGRESQPPGSSPIAGISEVGMIEDVERCAPANLALWIHRPPRRLS